MLEQSTVKLGVTVRPCWLVAVALSHLVCSCAKGTEAPNANDGMSSGGAGGAGAGGDGSGGSAKEGGASATNNRGSAGATSSAATASGGGDGGAPVACDSSDATQCVPCQQCAAFTECKAEYDACTAEPECLALSNCLTSCNGDIACEDRCVGQHASGAPLLDAAATCLFCSACVMACGQCP